MIRGFLPRVLGDVTGPAPGPTLVIIGGMHGNEPAGILAAQQVMPRLRAMGLRRGRAIALVGNRAAVIKAQRLQVRDLNRAFTVEQIEALHAQPETADDPEQIEQRALLTLIDDLASESDRPLVVLDLHTTSGGGPPFSVVPDALASRELAEALPFPAILGLLESVRGTFLERLTAQGHVGLGVETGQHDAPISLELHRATIWRILQEMRLIDREPADVTAALDAVDPELPAVVELVDRHGIEAGDDFRMRPGFEGFQAITRGEVLADDRRGPITAKHDGRIVMPLYQSQGDDGFFIMRDVSRAWLHATHVMRRLGVDRALDLVPGVRRAGVDTLQVPDTLSPALQKGLRWMGYRRLQAGVARKAREPRRPPWR